MQTPVVRSIHSANRDFENIKIQKPKDGDSIEQTNGIHEDSRMTMSIKEAVSAGLPGNILDFGGASTSSPPIPLIIYDRSNVLSVKEHSVPSMESFSTPDTSPVVTYSPVPDQSILTDHLQLPESPESRMSARRVFVGTRPPKSPNRSTTSSPATSPAPGSRKKVSDFLAHALHRQSPDIVLDDSTASDSTVSPKLGRKSAADVLESRKKKAPSPITVRKTDPVVTNPKVDTVKMYIDARNKLTSLQGNLIRDPSSVTLFEEIEKAISSMNRTGTPQSIEAPKILETNHRSSDPSLERAFGTRRTLSAPILESEGSSKSERQGESSRKSEGDHLESSDEVRVCLKEILGKYRSRISGTPTPEDLEKVKSDTEGVEVSANEEHRPDTSHMEAVPPIESSTISITGKTVSTAKADSRTIASDDIESIIKDMKSRLSSLLEESRHASATQMGAKNSPVQASILESRMCCASKHQRLVEKYIREPSIGSAERRTVGDLEHAFLIDQLKQRDEMILDLLELTTDRSKIQKGTHLGLSSQFITFENSLSGDAVRVITLPSSRKLVEKLRQPTQVR